MLSAHHSKFGSRVIKSKFSNVALYNTLMPLKWREMTNTPQFRGLLLFILIRSYFLKEPTLIKDRFRNSHMS